MVRLEKAFISVIFILLLMTPAIFAQEQLTITTYYPSPYGSYGELTAIRMKIGQDYAQSGYSVSDNNLIVQGKVGVGKDNPTYELDVTGTVNATAGYRVDASVGQNQIFTFLTNCDFVSKTCDSCSITFTRGIMTNFACT